MRIEVAPADALFDRALTRFRLSEFPPSREVRVRTGMHDDPGQRWESAAEFITNSSGVVDLALTAPNAGSYHVADTMGLFWSMQLDPQVEARTPFIKNGTDAVVVTITAELDGKPAASVQVIRRYRGDKIVRIDRNSDGLVGTLFHHETDRRPGIILVGGSGGGMSLDHAALLASQGFSVLALAYFAMPGLPADLAEIPLEYFERAIAWMRRHPAVDSEHMAAIGTSRGGELVLLLGATFPEITAVVAYVPSGVVWPGIRAAGGPGGAAWTHRGAPIPFVTSQPTVLSDWSKRPVVLTSQFLSMMKDRSDLERAAIAVEKINGPILMFSGTDDQMWPSLNLADLATQRLIEHDFAHPYEHVSYAGAGHFIRYPYSPVISEIFHPVVKAPMALGGSPENNHVADLDSWRRCLAFLHQHLGGAR
jgi:dienelactone hydrolase